MPPSRAIGLLFCQNALAVGADWLDFPIITPTEQDFRVDFDGLGTASIATTPETQKLPVYARQITEAEVPVGYQLQNLRQILPQYSPNAFQLLARAYQVLLWHKQHQFCGVCGTATQRHALGELATVCPACGHSSYPRINPCVITLITHADTLLLVRAHRFSTPMYSLVAGFVEAGESLEHAVLREVKEEVGIEVKNIQYYGSQPWPFPSNLMVGFQAEYASGTLVLQEDELLDGQFFHYNQLPLIPPKGSIAHDMILDAVKTLSLRHGASS